MAMVGQSNQNKYVEAEYSNNFASFFRTKNSHLIFAVLCHLRGAGNAVRDEWKFIGIRKGMFSNGRSIIISSA